jgi:hypothetical protein
MILLLVLYSYGTEVFHIKGMRVFGNRWLRRIFGPKRDEDTGD